MAYRTFVDEIGRTWEVWEVRPAQEGPRSWLAFQWDSERRRLMPAPEEWEHDSDEQLRMLLAQSVPAGRVRRLIE